MTYFCFIITFIYKRKIESITKIILRICFHFIINSVYEDLKEVIQILLYLNKFSKLEPPSKFKN